MQDLADRINWEHGTDRWQPVVFLNEHHGQKEITLLYRMAAGCVVSSLHDGMNLVAKEFVAARDDDRGVLVLSKFTGAAQELMDAILINPFDVEQLEAALHSALTMSGEEQERRMRRMRAQVEDHNIYRWAGQLLRWGKWYLSRCLAGRVANHDAGSSASPRQPWRCPCRMDEMREHIEPRFECQVVPRASGVSLLKARTIWLFQL